MLKLNSTTSSGSIPPIHNSLFSFSDNLNNHPVSSIENTSAYMIGKNIVRPAIDELQSIWIALRPSGQFFKASWNILKNTTTQIFHAKVFSGVTTSTLSDQELTPINADLKDLKISSQSCHDHYLGLENFQIVTHDKLLEIFEVENVIGEGSDSRVFKVRNKINGCSYAMVKRHALSSVDQFELSQLFFNQMLKIQDGNPHIAKIYKILTLKFKNVSQSDSDWINSLSVPEKGQLIIDKHKNNPDAQDNYLEVFIQELGESNLESTQFKQLNIDPLELHIQRSFSINKLIDDGIALKDINTIWIKNDSPYVQFAYPYKDSYIYLSNKIIVKLFDYSHWDLISTVKLFDYSFYEMIYNKKNSWLQNTKKRFDLTDDEIFAKYGKKPANVSEADILYLKFN